MLSRVMAENQKDFWKWYSTQELRDRIAQNQPQFGSTSDSKEVK